MPHSSKKIFVTRNISEEGYIPSTNVLDLRSLIAQNELKQQEQRSKRKKGFFFRRSFDNPRISQAKLNKEEVKESSVVNFEEQRMAKGKDIIKENIGHLSLSYGVLKPLVAFILLAVIFVLPAHVSAMFRGSKNLEGEIMASAQSAFKLLEDGGKDFKNFDFASANIDFQKSLERFREANVQLSKINSAIVSLARYIPGKGKALYGGKNLLLAGEEIAEAGAHITQALEALDEKSLSIKSDSFEDWEAIDLEYPKLETTPLLVILYSALLPAKENIQAAADYLLKVDEDIIPLEQRENFIRVKKQLPLIKSTVNNSLNITELTLTLLGHEEKKRYLFLFQNNNELRPTGGFIGSLALVDVEKGNISGLDVPAGGVYEIAGQLTKKIISPLPLHRVNPYWNIQDANWFPHFPASAQKIQWFYEYSKGPSVDGIIAIVPGVVEEMLKITGPIDLTDEFGVVITDKNFFEEVQERAEEKFDTTRESKRIIGVLLPKLLSALTKKMQTPQDLLDVILLLRTSLMHKDILLYMNDPLVQKELENFNWAGALKNTGRDYLNVVHANIAGGKTDGVIEETIRHKVVIKDNGEIVDTIKLTRIHKGTLGDPLKGAANTDYTRFYLPTDSTLLNVKGFDTPTPQLFLTPDKDAFNDPDYLAITGDVYRNEQTNVSTNSEFGKFVVGGWIETAAGESSTVEITYRLPFTIEVDKLLDHQDYYSLLIQKQPGSFGSVVILEVQIPDSLRASDFYPENFANSQQFILDNDYYIGMVLERAR